MEKKKITLSMLKNSLAVETKTVEIAVQPYMQVAALMTQFDIDELKLEVLRLFNYVVSEQDISELLKRSEKSDTPGEYCLNDSDRKQVLKQLDNSKELIPLAHKFSKSSTDILQNTFISYITGKAQALQNQQINQLACTNKVADWLKETSAKTPNIEDINTYIKREELLEPFRLLTKDFQGRQDALRYLSDYVARENVQKPLMLSGIGGIGKSTLVAKFILNHYEHDKEGRVPFVFIDFDRPGFTLSEPLLLASEGLKQLGIQFPKSFLTFKDIREDIKTFLGRNKEDSREFTKNSKSSSISRGLVYDSIARQYLHENQKTLGVLKKLNTPILVILDSFEEAQFRSTPTELDNLFQFFKELSKFIPTIRFILVGRDDLLDSEVERYKLGEFDNEAAKSFLKTRGIQNERLLETMVQRLDNNKSPLTLKLAANFVLNLSESQENIDFDILFKGITKERIQEELVRRNLAHIKGGEEVQAVGFPGMLVRKISPEIIQHVLAEPCGLGSITSEKAYDIFLKLQEVNFLLTRENNALVFRRDLRMAMYDLIIEQYQEKAFLIHDLAIKYYKDKPDSSDKAEYLYHKLKRGDDTIIIDTIYIKELRPYVENALTELPLNAYVHLAAKMGITIGADVVKKATLKEWETYMIEQIKDVLQEGEASGLQYKKKMLQEREDRSYQTNLFAYEAKLYIRLKEFEKAKSILENSETNKKHDFTYVILKSQLFEYQLQFIEAHEILYRFDFEDGKGQNLANYIEYIIASMRSSKRTGLKTPNLMPIITKIYSLISQNQEKDFKKKIGFLSEAFPITYRPFISEAFQSEKSIDSPQYLLLSFNSLAQYFLNDRDFMELHQDVTKVIEKQSLELMLLNKYGLYFANISEAGVMGINMVDVIFYLEQKYKGRLFDILKDFLEINPIRLVNKENSKEIEALEEKSIFSKEEKSSPPKGLSKEIKDNVRNLISKAELGKAIDILIETNTSPEMQNDLILLSSRYQSLKRQSNLGLITSDDERLQNARISNSLLNLLDYD